MRMTPKARRPDAGSPKIPLLVGALLGLSALALPATAFTGSTATVTARANVVAPISVTKTSDLAFGFVSAGAGVVTVATNGSRSVTGNAALVAGGPAATAARFDVKGSGSNSFSIDYAGSDTVLSNAAQDTMAIELITEAVGGTSPTGKAVTGSNAQAGALDAGAAYIYVGAALTVGANQRPGLYSGSIRVSVAYN